MNFSFFWQRVSFKWEEQLIKLRENHHDESRIQSEGLALVLGHQSLLYGLPIAEVVLIICQIFFLYQDFWGQAQVVGSVARFRQV